MIIIIIIINIIVVIVVVVVLVLVLVLVLADKLLSKFKTNSITKANELFYAGAFVVTNRLGVMIDKVAWRKEPMWKRRLRNKIKGLRKDLSQLEASKDKDMSKSIKVKRLKRII